MMRQTYIFCNFTVFVIYSLAIATESVTLNLRFPMRFTFPPGMSAKSIAAACGVDPVTIWRALGKGPCSAELVVLIHFASCGAIPCWKLKPKIWREGQIPPVPTLFDAHASSSSKKTAA